MKLANNLRLAAVSALLLSATSAFAATTFIGSDDGAGVGGPYTNSAAAEAAFLAAAAAYGTVTTDGFESAAVGYTSSVALNGATISTPGYPNFGAGFSGVSNSTLGSIYGFNTTAGGANWFGLPNNGPASATFTFASGTNSLGFWLTGVQSTFTSSITFLQNDGSSLSFVLPVNGNGGTNFFGVVDANSFTSATLTLNSSGDAWGIDDISYNGAAPGVPEPASWAMLIAGFGLVGAAARRRRTVAAA